MKKSNIILAISLIIVLIIVVYNIGYIVALIQIKLPGFSFISKSFILFVSFITVLFCATLLVIMIKKGGRLFAVVISLFVVTTSCADKTYTVTVDYGQTFTEMVQAGNYDYVAPNDKPLQSQCRRSTKASYPIPNERKGIKVFRKSKSFKSDKPLELLQPYEIDSLVKIANKYDHRMFKEYAKKYGLEKLYQEMEKSNFFESSICTVQYKSSKEILEIRLFPTLKEMKKAGFRSATSHEALSFGKEYQNIQKKYNIFAMGDAHLEEEYLGFDWYRDADIVRLHYFPVVLAGDDDKRKLDIFELVHNQFPRSFLYHSFIPRKGSEYFVVVKENGKIYHRDLSTLENKNRFLGVKK